MTAAAVTAADSVSVCVVCVCVHCCVVVGQQLLQQLASAASPGHAPLTQTHDIQVSNQGLILSLVGGGGAIFEL